MLRGQGTNEVAQRPINLLDGIVEAMENTGEQRPPGMMLIGWSVLSLEGDGDTTIQDDALTIESEQQLEAKDRERVQRWLKGRRWIVREGLDQSYRDALAAFHTAPLQLPAVAALRIGKDMKHPPP